MLIWVGDDDICAVLTELHLVLDSLETENHLAPYALLQKAIAFSPAFEQCADEACKRQLVRKALRHVLAVEAQHG